jgi:hypothetical protein
MGWGVAHGVGSDFNPPYCKKKKKKKPGTSVLNL